MIGESIYRGSLKNLFRVVFKRQPAKILISEFLNHKLCQLLNVTDLSFYSVQTRKDKDVFGCESRDQVTYFCKWARSSNFAQFIKNEWECYKYLEEKGVKNTAKLVYAENLGENSILLVTRAIEGKHKFLFKNCYSIIIRDLHMLKEKTTSTVVFEKGLFYDRLQYIRENLFRFNDDEFETSICRIMDSYVQRHMGHRETYSFCHGDFRLDNMLFQNGHMMLFDFERSKTAYPLNMDLYHLFCTAVEFRPFMLQRILPAFPWYQKEDFTAFMLDFIYRFISPSSYSSQLHQKWFLENFRKLWFAVIDSSI